jgi:cytochrome c biogenesis protein CcmG/thiol:disulfide interchange protein DsbE
VVALALAVVATAVIAGVVIVARPPADSPGIATGRPAPAFAGTTLDGAPLALADLRGRPVIVNFWGPSCVPCRDEFPLFIDELARHAADDLAIVGVLMKDSPGPARRFIADYGATWPTIDDPDDSIQKAYRAVARPQTYFIDRDGVLRGIQVGQLSAADFDRLYAAISGPAASATP